MTKRTLLIAIPIVAIVLNGLGYLIVVKSRQPGPTASTGGNGRGPMAPAAAPTAGKAAAPTEGWTGAGSGAAADDPAARDAQAQVRRAAGLTALEAGEYDKALINFTEAKSLIGDKANVDDLLRVTEELRRKPPAADGSSANANATKTRAADPARRERTARGSSRRIAVREEAPEESPASPSGTAAPSGLLIVTTTPRGMLVHVDDNPVDLTPMKTKVRPGAHRVALLDGDRKVYETTVDIREGATATILRDLSAERAEAARPVAAVPAPVVPRDEVPRAAPIAAPAPTTPPSSTPGTTFGQAPAPSAPAVAGEVGVLEISSPGLYGVVWVNGRPRGYPPLAVRDLPPGPAKVEVRVNGVQKRTATAMVKAGLTTSVKLRSLDGAP